VLHSRSRSLGGQEYETQSPNPAASSPAPSIPTQLGLVPLRRGWKRRSVEKQERARRCFVARSGTIRCGDQYGTRIFILEAADRIDNIDALPRVVNKHNGTGTIPTRRDREP